MKKINKKGELTTKKLVTMIVLIASFLIILFLLFRLNLGAVTDKEICHNSVVLKSQAKGLVGKLNCKTNSVCISGGGDCRSITEKIKVNPDNKEEILKVIADEMADCWWMFGEGKLNYVGETGNTRCVICSEIEFDESIQNGFNEITYLEFYNYLQKTQKSDAQSYLEYLYSTSDLGAIGYLDEDVESFSTADKFVVVTGIDPVLFLDNKIFVPYFLKPEEISEKTTCKSFLTTPA